MAKTSKVRKTNTAKAKTTALKKKTSVNVKKNEATKNLKNAKKEHFGSTKVGEVTNQAKLGTVKAAKLTSNKVKGATKNFKQNRERKQGYKRDAAKSTAVSNLALGAIASDTVKDLQSKILESEKESESALDRALGQS